MNPTLFVPTARPLTRRTFLRGAGGARVLPLLGAMTPAFASVAEKAAVAKIPRRMVAIETNMGILPQFYFPEKAGKDFPLTPYLEILKDLRQDMTVFSGVSHPDVDGGHQADKTFLTAAPHPGGGAFKNSISLDQVAAERIGALTRFGSFSLAVGHEAITLSFTRSGVAIPAEKSPAALYKRMFARGHGEGDRRPDRGHAGRPQRPRLRQRRRQTPTARPRAARPRAAQLVLQLDPRSRGPVRQRRGLGAASQTQDRRAGAPGRR